MNFEIVDKKENKLLERTEVNATVSFGKGTPTTQEIRDTVVQKLGCNPDLMVIRGVEPKFGEKKLSLRANIYKDAAQMKKVEQTYVLKRNKLLSEEEAKKKPKKAKKGKKT